MASLCEFGANSRSPATAVIPVLRRLVQGHEEFQASLGHKVSLCLNHLPPAHTKKRNHNQFFLTENEKQQQLLTLQRGSITSNATTSVL